MVSAREAYPEVRIYVWFVNPTEAAGVAYIRNRAPEISTENFQIPSDNMLSLELTDGISEVDDTFNLVFTEDAWEDYKRILDNYRSRDPKYVIIGITVNNRFFGPYDLETYGHSGESAEITLFGRIDREFEDTVISRWNTVFFSPAGSNTRLERLLSTTSPYSLWGRRGFSNLVSLITAQIGSSKNLSGIRGALNPYNIGVSPRTIPYITSQVGSAQFTRDVELYPKYPTIIDNVLPENQLIDYLEAGFFGDMVTSVITKPIPKLVSLTEADLWLDSPPSFNVKDANNAPGFYRNRRIDVAIKELNASALLYSSGTRLPRLVLDPGGQNVWHVIYIENARWKLQNTAAIGTLKVLGNVELLSGQFLEVDEIIQEYLLYPQWRVDSVKHSITPGEGHSTTLGIILVQGLYVPDVARDIIVANVPQPDDSSGTALEPEAESGVSFWQRLLTGRG